MRDRLPACASQAGINPVSNALRENREPTTEDTMKYTHYISLLTLFLVLGELNAQEKDWQWAKRGGGNAFLNSGSTIYSTGRERILEVAVDSQNNYYFIAEVGSSNVTYDGESITTYGDNASQKNIFVFSTDCDGELRWKKSIGGGSHDYVTSIKLDSDDNVYVAGRTINPMNSSSTPVHFDTDSIKPQALPLFVFDESKKGTFIIKYNQSGEFQWLIEPEGGYDTTLNGGAQRLYIDTENTLHLLSNYYVGSHLDGQLVVEAVDGEEFTSKNVITRWNSEGELQDFTPIDMSLGYYLYDYQFVYDTALSRYYIADTRRNTSDVISINGFGVATGNQKGFYLAALEADGEVIWYKENAVPSNWSIGDIQLDANGDIYFTGTASSTPNENDFFAGHEFEITQTSTVGTPFLLKLDSDGELIWGTNADLSTRFPGRSIALDGEDVYLGLGMYYSTWDGFTIDGIQTGGQVPDPTILRFNATTGSLQEVIRMPDNVSGQDEIMSIALDSHGSIIMGGHFSNTLLTNHPVPTLTKSGGDSDFFIAKYGTNICTLSTAEFTPTQLEIKLYPNPAHSHVYIESNTDLSVVEIFSIKGKQVLQTTPSPQTPIDISNLTSGIYLVKIHTAEGTIETKKLVVR